MEITLNQELNIAKMLHIFNKMMQYFEDCNSLEMTKQEFQELVDIQLAKIISEGRLDEVFYKLCN